MTTTAEQGTNGLGVGIDGLIGESRPAVERKLYHCGIVDPSERDIAHGGPPCENITLRHLSAPLRNVFYKNDDDEQGMVVAGSLAYLSEREHKEAIEKLDRMLVEWIGRNPEARAGEKRGRGVGPGRDFLSARIYDVKAGAIDVKRGNCEPLTRYVYVYEIEHSNHRYGEKPSVEAMRRGKRAILPGAGEIDELRRQLAEREAELALLTKAEGDHSEQKAQQISGKPLDPQGDAARAAEAEARKHRGGRR